MQVYYPLAGSQDRLDLHAVASLPAQQLGVELYLGKVSC